jgi:hypothetical protein
MKFNEALEHINDGCKMRSINWNSKCYFCRDHDDYLENKNFRRVEKIDLEDIDDEWEHLDIDKGLRDINMILGENLSFILALEFHSMSYKIARESWKPSVYVHCNQMYDGEKVFINKVGDMFDFDDVTADDWIAYK